MHCQLQSPERMLFDGEAKIVVAHSPEGEFAVMNGHAPLLAHVFALSGGVLQVTKDGVTILAHEAIPSGEIDLAAVSARREELAGSEGAGADAFQGDTLPGEQEIAFLDVQKKLGENHE